MLEEQFHQILDQLTKWKISAHQTFFKDRDRAKEINEPIKGYPVVLSHNVQEHNCEWCDNKCRYPKTYRRYIVPKGNCNWTGKCADCGTTKEIPYNITK